MIEKIKNLPFVTLQEKDNLEDITIEYLDNGTITIGFINLVIIKLMNWIIFLI